MSWTRRRPLLAVASLALLLRVGTAVVTERRPIFPPYYYTDATRLHAEALSALDDIAAGRRPVINGMLGERIQTWVTLQVYRACGPRPLAIKLFNALLGALGIAALYAGLRKVFSEEAALAAAAAVALWPSHVFYTSQNLKEAPADLLAYAGLAAALAAGRAGGARAAAPLALAAAAALFGAGLYRSYVLIALSAGLLLAFALAALDASRRAAASTAAAGVVAALALYSPASRLVHASFTSIETNALQLEWVRPTLIPRTFDEFSEGAIDHPTSPRGISQFRRSRQFSDRRWASHLGRDHISTQIYPDAQFDSWADVLLYVPKGAFTVLFQPLPGLYPMDGKVGRYAAAAENSLLLLFAVLAAAGLLRGPKSPERLGLLAFFAVMLAGASLLEFDLGSAGRHKLLYLPMLFPFAAEEARRLLGGKEPA